MRNHILRLVTLSLVTLILGLCSFLQAQDFATLNGTVTDPTGAAVASAKLEIRNEATNISSSAIASEQGTFRFSYLQPGSFTVTCEASGFKKFTRTSILLVAGQVGYLSIPLEVGAVNEQVTVTAESPLLEATTASRGDVLVSKQLTEIPQQSRNAVMLALMGVSVAWRGGSAQEFANGSIAEWIVNGSPEKRGDYLLDGAPDDSMAGSNNIALAPAVDAVDEMRVNTNSYDAEFGHTAGGIISFTTKSGTNEFHGNLYEFAQRTDWEANSFANNAQGVPRTATYLNQYGFTAAGPVFIPKVYNGRDKTFFMVNLEEFHQNLPWPVTASVPAPEMLQGDFSKLTNTAGQPILIYDPSTGQLDANGNWVRTPFPNNQIPSNRINPIAQKILSYFPSPTRPEGPGLGYTQNNFYFGQTNVYPYYAVTLKFDQNFGSKNRVFYRFAKSNWTAHNWNGNNGDFGTPGETAEYIWRTNDADMINWVSTLSPHEVFSLRVSFNQFIEANSQTPPNFGFDVSKFGLPASTISQLPNPTFFGVFSFSGYSNLGQNGYVNLTNTFALAPQISIVRGSHNIKAGADIRWIRYNNSAVQNSWGMQANAVLTQKNYLVPDATSGNSIAAFLLGNTSATASYVPQPLYSIHYYAPYVQDDWRINRKLTLNLGLRWDLYGAPTERFNRLTRGFATTAVNPVTPSVNLSLLPGGAQQLLGGLLFAGVGGVPTQTFNTSYTNFQPRIGGAYQFSDKLVFRGGWGRYFINPDNSSMLNTGFSYTTSSSYSNDGGRTGVTGMLSNPFPTGVIAPVGSSLGLATYLGQGFNWENPDLKVPHADLFTLGFQYRLPLSSVLEITYAGNRSSNLQAVYPANEASLSVRQRCDWAEGGNPATCDALMPNPFYQLAPFKGSSLYTAPTVSYYQLSRTYPEFSALNEVGVNGDKTWYNALQVSWQTKQFKYANIMVNYSYSKMMMTGFSSWYLGSGADYFDIQQKQVARGIYEGDMAHQFKAAVVYNFPFGKGNRWLNTSNPILDRVVGGWQLSTYFRWNSGVPAPFPSNTYYLKDASVPNINWKPQTVQMYSSCVAQWNYNGTISMLPYSAAEGCTSYNWLIQPSYAPRVMPYYDASTRVHTVPVADVLVAKTVNIKERLNLQLRMEAYNVANTQNAAGNIPDTNPLNSTFGSFRLASGGNGYYGANSPRVVQLAAKLIW